MLDTLLKASCLVVFLAACSGAAQDDATAPGSRHLPMASQAVEARFGSWGVETEYVSTEIEPGDNFYFYVNEGWIDQAQFPAGFAFYNAPWRAQIEVWEDVTTLIEDTLASPAPANSSEERVSHFYQSFLDREAINAGGLIAIEAELARIETLRTHSDIAGFMGELGANTLFNLIVQAPFSMEGGYMLTVAQYRTTGLGLPSQDHYLSQEENFDEHRAAYVDYITTTLAEVGIEDARRRAEDILAAETLMAGHMWTFAQLRDAGAVSDLVPVSELIERAPGFDWAAFLETRGLEDLAQINIGIGGIVETAAVFGDVSVETWRDYLTFHWVNSHADLLPDEFSQRNFQFFSQQLFGTQEREDITRRAIDFVERYIGEELGQVYVDVHFPPEYEAQIMEMVGYIQDAFREKLMQADWMDSATRDEAIAKLDLVVVEIGQPKAGPDWTQLVTSPTDPVSNISAARQLRWDYARNRIGGPISRMGDWNMHAHDIGWGYHQQYNKIFATAGALLPPFFDPAADPAVNFGTIGFTIAHEFGHALDDQGSAFDRNGVLRNWWTDETRTLYEQRTTGLIDQFSQYEMAPGVTLRSEQMIGEIVGDMVGISVAYRAYELYAEANGIDLNERLDGFTAPQRLFLAAAQQSREISTPAIKEYQALNASHPPAEHRINGIFRNLDAWYEAFEVDPDHEMYLPPEHRITLW